MIGKYFDINWVYDSMVGWIWCRPTANLSDPGTHLSPVCPHALEYDIVGLQRLLVNSRWQSRMHALGESLWDDNLQVIVQVISKINLNAFKLYDKKYSIKSLSKISLTLRGTTGYFIWASRTLVECFVESKFCENSLLPVQFGKCCNQVRPFWSGLKTS